MALGTNWDQVGIPGPTDSDNQRVFERYLDIVRSLSRQALTNFSTALYLAQIYFDDIETKTPDEIRALWETPLSDDFKALDSEEQVDVSFIAGTLCRPSGASTSEIGVLMHAFLLSGIGA